jgi:xanthine dehydrogenase small subunit
MPREVIRFLRRGIVVEHHITNPMQTVLAWLRAEERSRGTKEGCGEGDCGACTIVLGRLRDGKVHYDPVNACILLMGHLHACELVTVDDLAVDGKLHPVQQAMVDQHGSQCGFCTPGFVMSLFALYHSGKAANRQMTVDQIAGNLCRCTGYRPIVDAALESCTGKAKDLWSESSADIAAELKKLDDGEDVFCGNSETFTAIPSRPETLCDLVAKHADATVVAGATDVGLWITKQLRHLPKLIFTGRVDSLRATSDRVSTLSLGSAVTYAEAQNQLAALSPDVGEVLRRLGSRQVRSSGTIGGNIANGSPIGDMPPLLIALGARLVLRKGNDQRDLLLEDYFIDYGKQDRKPGELVWRLDIPKLKTSERFFAHKITKRFDQDISSVLAAFKFTIVGRVINQCTLAFGGMAATPRRARKTEDALKGLKLDAPDTWQKAVEMLAQDFAPISDLRASANYRMETAQALLLKALHELVGERPASLRILSAAGKDAWT